jgi:hypothetical protein
VSCRLDCLPSVKVGGRVRVRSEPSAGREVLRSCSGAAHLTPPECCTLPPLPLLTCLRPVRRGPLYYVVVLGVMCGVFWRDSPLGILAIAAMCGGDGMADIIGACANDTLITTLLSLIDACMVVSTRSAGLCVGRQFGGACLPFNRDKSWAGSAAMLVFGSLLSIGYGLVSGMHTVVGD